MANDASIKRQRPSSKDYRSLLVFLASLLYWSARYAGLSNVIDPFLQRKFEKRGFARDKAWWWASDCYNLAMVVVLIALWLAAGHVLVVDIIVTAVAIARLYEIYMVILRILVSDLHPGVFKPPLAVPEHDLEFAVRHVLVVPVYLLQLTLIFSTLFQTLGAGQVVDSLSGMNVPVVGHWPFVYLSWTTLTTLGSGYTFTGTAARTLAMVDVASGIGMLAVVLSIFVGAIRVRADSSSD